MRAIAKIFGARASEHSSKFCEQIAQRPNFASTRKIFMTIRYPFCSESLRKRKHKQFCVQEFSAEIEFHELTQQGSNLDQKHITLCLDEL